MHYNLCLQDSTGESTDSNSRNAEFEQTKSFNAVWGPKNTDSLGVTGGGVLPAVVPEPGGRGAPPGPAGAGLGRV